MRDDRLFDEDSEKEASIFVHPYYSEGLKQERMTKSTTFILVDKERGVRVREVSYGRGEGEESRVVDVKLELESL